MKGFSLVTSYGKVEMKEAITMKSERNIEVDNYTNDKEPVAQVQVVVNDISIEAEQSNEKSRACWITVLVIVSVGTCFSSMAYVTRNESLD